MLGLLRYFQNLAGLNQAKLTLHTDTFDEINWSNIHCSTLNEEICYFFRYDNEKRLYIAATNKNLLWRHWGGVSNTSPCCTRLNGDSRSCGAMFVSRKSGILYASRGGTRTMDGDYRYWPWSSICNCAICLWPRLADHKRYIQGYPHKFLAWLGTGYIRWCHFLEGMISREIIYLLQQQ